MKQLFLSVILCLAMLSACNSRENKTENDIIGIEQLLALADDNIGRKFTIEGSVSHVCSHSGRRCFIVDNSGEFSIRVEADGEIGNFSRELMGNTIRVSGRIQENRLSAGEIDEWEKEIEADESQHAQNDGEHCSAEMANINRMREWMKENGRDYYAIYFFEGLSYEVVEQ